MAGDLTSLLAPLRSPRTDGDAWAGDDQLAPEALPSLEAVRPETLRRLGLLPDGSAIYIVVARLRASLATAPVGPAGETQVALLRLSPAGDGVDVGRAVDARGLLANGLMAKEPLGRRHVRLVGVVPDGVAEVVVTGGGHTEAIRPRANMWFTEIPRRVARWSTVAWLDDGRRVLDRFGLGGSGLAG